MIPDFIETNKFLLQKLNVDLKDTDELLKVIRGENIIIKGVKNLFMGFIGSRIFKE